MSTNNLISRFREPSSAIGAGETSSETYRNRHNYMTLANVVELTSAIVAESLNMSDGVNNDETLQKIGRKDIADLVVTQTAAHIDEARGE